MIYLILKLSAHIHPIKKCPISCYSNYYEFVLVQLFDLLKCGNTVILMVYYTACEFCSI